MKLKTEYYKGYKITFEKDGPFYYYNVISNEKVIDEDYGEGSNKNTILKSIKKDIDNGAYKTQFYYRKQGSTLL